MTITTFAGRKLIFDTETTGFRESSDRVVEIGIIEVIDFKVTDRKPFHVYINPMKTMTEEVIKVHGLTNEFLQDKPVMRAVMPEFLDYIGDSDLVAHNAPFDMGMLNAELRRLGKRPLKNRVIDTLVEARIRLRASRLNLDALCDRFGVDRSSRTTHTALVDARLLADVYIKMLGGASELNLAATTMRGHAPVSPSGRCLDIKPDRNIGGPSAAESQAHQAFVESMNKPIWFRN